MILILCEFYKSINSAGNLVLLAQQQIELNAPIHVEATILKPVVGAASEAEIAAACANGKERILTMMQNRAIFDFFYRNQGGGALEL